jgi:MurNAc alpha-1-phosphate uridylyltransferase
MLPVAILAGGLATRLRPLTETVPKALVEIRGEPFLGHQLRLLRRAGIERVVLCVSYRGEQIREFARDGRAWDLQVDYSWDGPRLLGTAGAVRQALPLLGENFFVLYGDSYLPCDYAAIQETFLQARKNGLMTVHRNEGRWDTSNVEFAQGRILLYDKLKRTRAMRHIDYGLGVFARRAFENRSSTQASDLATVYQDLLRRDDLAAFEVPDRFYEIGSAEGIRDLEEFLSR